MDPYQISIEHVVSSGKVCIRLTNINKDYILDWSNHDVGLQKAFTVHSWSMRECSIPPIAFVVLGSLIETYTRMVGASRG